MIILHNKKMKHEKITLVHLCGILNVTTGFVKTSPEKKGKSWGPLNICIGYFQCFPLTVKVTILVAFFWFYWFKPFSLKNFTDVNIACQTFDHCLYSIRYHMHSNSYICSTPLFLQKTCDCFSLQFYQSLPWIDSFPKLIM